MPVVLKPDHLKPGMKLDAAIKRGPVTLLPAHRVVTEDDIATLVKRYPEYRVRVADAALDAVVHFEDDSRDREIADQVKEKATQAVTAVIGEAQRDAKRPAHRGAKNDNKNGTRFCEAERAVHEIIQFIIDHPVGAVLPKDAYTPDSYLADHAANVFYLAVTLGGRCIDYVVTERERQTHSSKLNNVIARNLQALGLGVMFMDLGMIELEQLDNKEEPLTRGDWELIKEHPDRGAKLLPNRFPPAARMVVRTHHENMDRSGYPDAIAPEKMHIFTRIVRICDAFDAAITPRPWRPQAKSAIRVLWEMTAGPRCAQFDPVLAKAFSRMIQPFPIGQKLMLNNYRQAVVVAQSQDAFSPRVVIAFDEEGKVLPKEKISPPIVLSRDTDCPFKILSANGEDLSYLYEVHDTPAHVPPTQSLAG